MSILNFRKSTTETPSNIAGLLQGYSLEVMPRTAAKIDSFAELLPAGTRIYIAHIDGTPIDDMVETAARLAGEGFNVMPHFPARIINDAATLEDWIKRYQDAADVKQALVLAGGVSGQQGEFHSSMQLLETGLFDKYGFTNLHVAGHPEGNKDIDPDGSTRLVDEAAQWKQAFSQRSDADMAMATQFAFEAKAVTDWAERLAADGIDLPIHVGVAGPAKLQTLLKFSIACGVGASLKVLQKRAKDVTKLLLPYEPNEVLSDLATYKEAHPNSLIQSIHVFPLGGIKTSATYLGNATAAGDGGNVSSLR